MPTIQIVMDAELLEAADRVARGRRMNRSALIREALRGHLGRLRALDLERRDREGYRSHPDTADDPDAWGGVAQWPRE